MLGRFLTAGVLLLAPCVALPRNSALPTNAVSATDTYAIRLPYPDPESDGSGRSFLTITFAADNDTLLANDSPIFPPSVPMQLRATRHWEFNNTEVSLSFALVAKPLSSHDGFSLNVAFFGPRGATADTVAIGLVQDPEGNLLISNVRATPVGDRSRPWRVDWRTRVSTYLMAMKHGLSGYKDAVSASHSEGKPEGTYFQPPHNSKSNKPANPLMNASPTSHTTNRGAPDVFLHFCQVLLPGLLGMLAGLAAACVGFMVGRMLVSVYLFFWGEGRPISPVSVEVVPEKDDASG